MVNHRRVKFPCGDTLEIIDAPIRGDEIEDDDIVTFRTGIFTFYNHDGYMNFSLELRSIPILIDYLMGIYDYYKKGLVNATVQRETEVRSIGNDEGYQDQSSSKGNEYTSKDSISLAVDEQKSIDKTEPSWYDSSCDCLRCKHYRKETEDWKGAGEFLSPVVG